MPQSNQHGIETVDRKVVAVIHPWRLNRTSVGLKRRDRSQRSWARSSISSLNRTSVGLKLEVTHIVVAFSDAASIEPAWD